MLFDGRIGWKLNIDRETVGEQTRFRDEFGCGVRNGLEVDIAAKIFLLT